MLRISSAVRDLSLRNFVPMVGSADHGGITRRKAASLMAFAQGLTSPYEVSAMGPISPG